MENLHPIVNDHLAEVEALCRKYQIEQLYAFGSVTRQRDFTQESDIDLIARFDERKTPPEEIGETLFNMTEELESLFHRPIDLIRDKPFRNPVFQRVADHTKVLIYDRRNV